MHAEKELLYCSQTFAWDQPGVATLWSLLLQIQTCMRRDRLCLKTQGSYSTYVSWFVSLRFWLAFYILCENRQVLNFCLPCLHRVHNASTKFMYKFCLSKMPSPYWERPRQSFLISQVWLHVGGTCFSDWGDRNTSEILLLPVGTNSRWSAELGN